VATRKVPKFGRSISELLNIKRFGATLKGDRETIESNYRRKQLRIFPVFEADSSTKDSVSLDGRSSKLC